MRMRSSVSAQAVVKRKLEVHNEKAAKRLGQAPLVSLLAQPCMQAADTRDRLSE